MANAGSTKEGHLCKQSHSGFPPLLETGIHIDPKASVLYRKAEKINLLREKEGEERVEKMGTHRVPEIKRRLILVSGCFLKLIRPNYTSCSSIPGKKTIFHSSLFCSSPSLSECLLLSKKNHRLRNGLSIKKIGITSTILTRECNRRNWLKR